MRYWESRIRDPGALFDRHVRLDASQLPPLVTWGRSPQDVGDQQAPCRALKRF